MLWIATKLNSYLSRDQGEWLKLLPFFMKNSRAQTAAQVKIGRIFNICNAYVE